MLSAEDRAEVAGMIKRATQPQLQFQCEACNGPIRDGERFTFKPPHQYRHVECPAPPKPAEQPQPAKETEGQRIVRRFSALGGWTVSPDHMASIIDDALSRQRQADHQAVVEAVKRVSIHGSATIVRDQVLRRVDEVFKRQEAMP